MKSRRSALGDLLRSEKKYQAAAAAYELVTRSRAPIRNCCRKRIWEPAKCTTSFRKRDLAVKKYEAVVAIEFRQCRSRQSAKEDEGSVPGVKKRF